VCARARVRVCVCVCVKRLDPQNVLVSWALYVSFVEKNIYIYIFIV